MELFQELLFTISFSLIVSLLIAKLFSIASTSDDGYSFNSTVSKRVVEKIEQDWVFCGEKDEKVVCVEDKVKGDDLGSGVVVKEGGRVGVGDECYVFDEMPERSEVSDECYVFDEMPERSEVDDCVKSVEVERRLSVGGVGEGKVVEEGEVFDDDWQGIETTELEKWFGAAVAFVDSKSGADRVNLVDNEVKVELYGLHKVAIEGSCFEPQPMALKVSARANWNSWKRLENLGREDAMEQYIALLSQHVPDWMGRHASDKQ